MRFEKTKIAYFMLVEGNLNEFKKLGSDPWSNFDSWHIGKLVANNVEHLTNFLNSIDYEKAFPNGVPGCILRRLTPKTKAVYDNFFSTHGINDSMSRWYYNLKITCDSKYYKEDDKEYPSFDDQSLMATISNHLKDMVI